MPAWLSLKPDPVRGVSRRREPPSRRFPQVSDMDSDRRHSDGVVRDWIGVDVAGPALKRRPLRRTGKSMSSYPDVESGLPG
jgi:hypothetical protein